MNSYATRRFWDRLAQIRNALDRSLSFHEAQARSIEQATAEAYDEACSPWFDDSAFLREPPSPCAVLNIVNMLLEDVAEKPDRLTRAQEIAARDIPPLL